MTATMRSEYAANQALASAAVSDITKLVAHAKRAQPNTPTQRRTWLQRLLKH